MDREAGKLIGIIFLITVLVVVAGTIIFLSIQYPERRLDVGAHIESIEINDNLAEITLSGGANNKEIERVKFIFTDSKGVQHYYSTVEGIENLSKPYKKSIINLFKEPEFEGTYKYTIDSNEIGFENFDSIYKVEVVFDYEKDVLEVDKDVSLDSEIINEGSAPSGGGGGSSFTPDSDLIPTLKAYWKYENSEVTLLNDMTYGTSLTLVLEHSGISSGTNVEFTIYEKDWFEDDYMDKLNTNVGSNGYAYVDWIITEAHVQAARNFLEGNKLELYFKVNGLESDVLKIGFVEAGVEPNCYDGIKNQNETGTDCGGECGNCFTGTAYYVSSSIGNDNNDGLTEQTPWQTLQYAEEQVTKPGDVIALKRGDVWFIANVLEINTGGNSTHDIVWDGGFWGEGDKALIKATADGTYSPIWFSTVHIADSRYLTFQNIKLDLQGHNRYGLTIGGSDGWDGPTKQNNEHHITIQDSEIVNVGDGTSYQMALLVRNSHTPIHNITIQRNTIANVAAHEIAIYPTWLQYGGSMENISDVYIGYNNLTNMSIYSGHNGKAITITRFSKNIIVEHNNIIVPKETNTQAIAVGAAFDDNGTADTSDDVAQFPSNITIRYNNVRLLNPTGTGSSLFISNAYGPVSIPMTVNVYGNLFYNAARAASLGEAGIWIQNYRSAGGDFHGAKFNIHHNTIVTGGAVQFREDTDDNGTVILRNNIFISLTNKTNYAYSVGFSNSGTTIHNNNIYYKPVGGDIIYYISPSLVFSETDIPTWEPTAITSDPLLADLEGFDWHLQQGSPAIDAGADLGYSYLGNAPDIGAFESPYIVEIQPDYYVSSSTGNDNNDGTSSSTPWQTIAKVNSVPFQPGDIIAFKSGDVWRESLIMSWSGSEGNPIVFTAYGQGAKPLITGFTTLTSWTSQGSGIYSTSCPNCVENLNIVLIDNQNTPMGRWPNQGYLTIDSAVGTTSITDNDLSSSLNWNGGKVVIRKNHWTLDRNPIISHLGDTITYETMSPSYEGRAGYGYFIQNHLSTLDSFGEWYYNGNDLYVYFDGNNPNNYLVEASTIDTLIPLNDYDYLTFDGLAFSGANNEVFYIEKSDYITLKNIYAEFLGTDFIEGPWGSVSNALTIEDSVFNHSNSNVLDLKGSFSDTVIRNNFLNNTGIYAGMGGSQYDQYFGIVVYGPNTIIENNRIDNTGYVPIRFEGGGNSQVKNNFITNFAFVKDDGGGIYTYRHTLGSAKQTGSVIKDNIIIYCPGAPEGTPSTFGDASGIYLDGYTAGVNVFNNTVAHCDLSGVLLSSNEDGNIMDNVLYDNRRQFWMLKYHSVSQYPLAHKDVSMYNNVLVSKEPTQMVFYYSNYYDNFFEPTFSSYSNYFIRPFGDDYIIYDQSNSKAHTLLSWQTLRGLEQNTKLSSINIGSYTVNNLLSSNLFTSGSFDSDTNGAYCWNDVGSCVISLDDTAGMDGNAMKISFTAEQSNTLSAITLPIGELSEEKDYVLRFSFKGSVEDSNFQTYLRILGPPYSDLTPRHFIPITTSREEHEIIFTAPISETGAAIGFEIDQEDGTIWFDNIELYEADISSTNPDDYFLFEYNPTMQDKVIALSGSYIDVDGNPVSGSITLKPYRSIVLIKGVSS